MTKQLLRAHRPMSHMLVTSLRAVVVCRGANDSRLRRLWRGKKRAKALTFQEPRPGG